MQQWLNHQKVRFLLAGVFNTGLDFLMLNTLVFAFSLRTLYANSISVTIGITVSYFLNHHFVFRQTSKISFRKYASFFAVTGFSALVLQNIVIIGGEHLFESKFGHSLIVVRSISGHQAWELNIAKAFAVGVGMVWNFTMYKRVIFKAGDNTDTEDRAVLPL